MVVQVRARSMEVGIRLGPWLAQSPGEPGAQPALVRGMPPGTTLADALVDLMPRYPRLADYLRLQDGRLTTQFLCVAVNGEAVSLPDALSRELKNGDRLILLVALAGD